MANDVNLPTFGQPRKAGPVVIDVKPNDYNVDEAAETELQNNLAVENAGRMNAESGGIIEHTASAPTTPNVTQTTSAPSDMSSQIQEALHNGYTSGELKTYLQGKGYSEDDADLQIIDSVKSKIVQAREAGYTDGEVIKYLTNNGYDSDVVERSVKSAKLDDTYKSLEFVPDTVTPENAMDMADLYKNVYGKYSTMGKQLGGMFDHDIGIQARQEINQLNAAVAEKLKKEGMDAFIDNNTGEVMLRDKNGVVSEVDSSMLNGMWNSKGELAGAITGGIRGAQIGGRIGMAAGPWGTAAGVAVGTVAGSAMGAMAGRGLDLAINSKILSEDLTAKLYMRQMAEAGIFDGVSTILGGALFKAGAATGRGIMKAYKYVASGNTRGAYRALKENLNITDDQAQAMVAEFERINNIKMSGTPEENAISVVAQTKQGAESVVKAAANQSERVATMIKESVDNRAKAINQTVDSVTDPNVGSLIRKDLNAYEADVKDFFDIVKKQGNDAINGTDFRFDFDKLATKPVLDNIEKGLSNPSVRERFANYAQRIANASEDRTFSGLLELRSAVNEFKYGVKLRKPDLDAINEVLNKVDNQIAKAVKEYMPGEAGRNWQKNFSLAKSEYSKMKVLQQNSLHRIISRPGITEDGIQKAISKYGNAKEVDSSTFNEVVERLSPATRAKAEGAAIKNLTNKYTYGVPGEAQATHFPALAEEVRGLNLSTPEAKGLANVIEEIAKVYKNDANLGAISSKTIAVRQQANLSSDIVQKAKYTVIGALWGHMVKHLPGQNSRNIALVHKVAEVLKNPLHAKTAEDFIKMIPKAQQGEMRSLVRELQIETAKTGGVKQSVTTNMYKQSARGNLAVTDGVLGKGIYLVDKVANPNPAMKVIRQEVDTSKLATLDIISNLVGRDVTEKEIRTIKDLPQKLMDKGYLGIRLDGRAMLFPETTIKKAKSK